jgi:hypothetical protein
LEEISKNKEYEVRILIIKLNGKKKEMIDERKKEILKDDVKEM